MIRKILLLGDPHLYESSKEVKKEELATVKAMVSDLHDTLMAYRRTYGAGRAVAAPQIGIFKRVLYLCVDEPLVMINPVLSFPSEEKIEVLDDCMSFPGLYVRVERYRYCDLRYLDENWQEREMHLHDDLAELIQHEYDHLEGILATDRSTSRRNLEMKAAFVPQKEER